MILRTRKVLYADFTYVNCTQLFSCSKNYLLTFYDVELKYNNRDASTYLICSLFRKWFFE